MVIAILWFSFRVCIALAMLGYFVRRWGPEKWFRVDGIYRPVAPDAPMVVKIINILAEPAVLVATVCGFSIVVLNDFGA